MFVTSILASPGVGDSGAAVPPTLVPGQIMTAYFRLRNTHGHNILSFYVKAMRNTKVLSLPENSAVHFARPLRAATPLYSSDNWVRMYLSDPCSNGWPRAVNDHF